MRHGRDPHRTEPRQAAAGYVRGRSEVRGPRDRDNQRRGTRRARRQEHMKRRWMFGPLWQMRARFMAEGDGQGDAGGGAGADAGQGGTQQQAADKGAAPEVPWFQKPEYGFTEADAGILGRYKTPEDALKSIPSRERLISDKG